ncbi:MAG: type II toxin-antitoxin system RelE/ParE family toxin [Novosphingobium sp.]|uniref:type II toxin-antitoxin system RelE/ParE family toxin n=1 Tax=Novosphingobium sp. TaxID=1874826 RepID=UPI003B9D9093
MLTAHAEADLRAILRYTRSQWGAVQARHYALRLETGIVALAKKRTLGRDLRTLHDGLRVGKCEHHYIFCQDRANRPALILAILHERMDLMARLADRLDGS